MECENCSMTLGEDSEYCEFCGEAVEPTPEQCELCSGKLADEYYAYELAYDSQGLLISVNICAECASMLDGGHEGTQVPRMERLIAGIEDLKIQTALEQYIGIEKQDNDEIDSGAETLPLPAKSNQQLTSEAQHDSPILFINPYTGGRITLTDDRGSAWSGALARMVGRKDWKYALVFLAAQGLLTYTFSGGGSPGILLSFLIGYGLNLTFSNPYDMIWIKDVLGNGYIPARRSDIDRVRKLGVNVSNLTAEALGIPALVGVEQSAASVDHSSAFEAIERLTDFRDRGILTPEQFERKVNHILGES